MRSRFILAILSTLAAIATLGLAAGSARADAYEDFADALQEYTGRYHSAWVLTKLTTFQVGPKCAAKLADKNQGALHAASFYTRDIAEYAKTVTGEDWARVEEQNNNDREKNKKLVEPMMDAFRARFSMTVSVDGADCDAKQSALWLRYWTTLGTAIRNYPPKAKKVTVKLIVTSKARDVTVAIDKDGSSFTFTAPRDIEAREWSDKLEKPFRRIVAGLPDEITFALKEYTGRYTSAWVLSKFTQFKVGKKCLAKLPDKDAGFLHAASFYTRDILEYAKAITNDDWEGIENQSTNDAETNREIAAKMMDEFKSKLSITISVDGDDCDTQQSALWLRYMTTIATALRNYPPKARKVSIKLDVKAKAKDVSVSAAKDGASFKITAPRDIEAGEWSDKLEKPFRKASKSR